MDHNQTTLIMSGLVYAGSQGGDAQTWNNKLSAAGLTDWQFLQESPANSDHYFGVAFENTNTHEIILANRGSTFEDNAFDWRVTDAGIFFQFVPFTPPPAAFDDALNFASSIQTNNSGFTFFETGHSLGGGEAQYVASQLNIPGTTYAAPGVRWATSAQPANVTNYTFVGEPIGNFGPHFGTVVTLLPNGPIQVIDFAQTQGLPLGPIGLHLLDNYYEHFGLPASLPAAGFVESFASFATQLILDVTGPFEPKETLPVSIGGTATISRAFLWSTDTIFGDDRLTYKVLAPPSHGTLLVNGKMANSFTQGDIDRGVLQYHENGSAATGDSFTFIVTDPLGRHTPIETFDIAIVKLSAGYARNALTPYPTASAINDLVPSTGFGLSSSSAFAYGAPSQSLLGDDGPVLHSGDTSSDTVFDFGNINPTAESWMAIYLAESVIRHQRGY